jgi:hypothetical protein
MVVMGEAELTRVMTSPKSKGDAKRTGRAPECPQYVEMSAKV